MADNVNINDAGNTSVPIATDNIGGVSHQRVKVQHGADGSATDVSSVDPFPVTCKFSDSPNIDAFGRLRTSDPGTVFDIKQLFDKQPLFFDESITNNSGSATSTHSTTDAATTMHVETNDTIIRQTKIRYNYQPGKSQLFYLTGVLGAAVSGVTRRIGAFDANNGLFFELSGSTLSVVKRKATSDTSIAQASWNLDTLDGNGPSGITIDTSKTQIFVIDYEWLGVGRVRFGVIVGGVIIYCHQFLHGNIETSVYISTPNLPIRYEIASTTGTGDLIHICSTVISEGGNERLGVLRTLATGATHVDANATDTVYAVLGIRLKSSHIGASISPIRLSVISETNDDFRWILSYNPTIADTFTYSDISNSCVQGATGATANTVSNLGITIGEGYASTDTQSIEAVVETSLRLGSLIDGTPDELVLSVMPLSSGADIQAAIIWKELL